jgi:GNAT superfamily N-acetyltransferase
VGADDDAIARLDVYGKPRGGLGGRRRMMDREIAIAQFERRHLVDVVALFAAQGWSYAEDEERTWRALTAPGSTCVVALADGTVAGVAHVLSDGEIQSFLSILVVGEAFRRQGVGRRLLLEAFTSAGTQRLDLTSCVDEFYEALGFRRLTAFRISRDELDGIGQEA